MQLTISITSVQNWETGGNGNISITNNGSTINNWQFQLTTQGYEIQSFWQLSMSGSGNNINVMPPSWNPILNEGQTITSGFNYISNSSLTSLPATSTTPGITIKNSTSTSNSTISTVSYSKNIFGYYAEWDIYGRKYPPSSIPLNKITHICYAFLMPNPTQSDFNKLVTGYTKAMGFTPNITWDSVTPQSELTYFDPYASTQEINNGIPGGNIGYLKYIKSKYPNMKVIISVGGWTLSWIFSLIAGNQNGYSRTVFAKSCASYLVNNGFDGIDLDWEFPGRQGIGYNYVDTNDASNLLLLAQELRTALDTASPNKHLLLTAAVGCDPSVIFRYKGTNEYFDYLNLMTYDFYGPWGPGGHHPGMFQNPVQTDEITGFTGDAAVKNALSIGIPSHQLSIGSPFYGRGWNKLIPVNNGPIIFGIRSSATRNTGSIHSTGNWRAGTPRRGCLAMRACFCTLRAWL